MTGNLTEAAWRASKIVMLAEHLADLWGGTQLDPVTARNHPFGSMPPDLQALRLLLDRDPTEAETALFVRAYCDRSALYRDLNK